MQSISLNLNSITKLDQETFAQICQSNPELKLELNSTGELVIMSPTGGITGKINSDINTELNLWNRQTNLGVVFDSSTGFRLPNGANRSPDVAWISLTRWRQLTIKEQEKFIPLCPDFVIELRSTSDNLKNLQDKLTEYIDNGTSLGWLINRQDNQIEIYRQGKPREVLSQPSLLTGEMVLLGFTLNLDFIRYRMNQNKSIKVAVVGTGFGEKIHIPGFQEHPETEVIAVYHRDIIKAREIAQSQQIPYAFDSLDELLSLESLDGVSIATPPFLHYEMAKKVLLAQKHLILEKPMTLKTDEIKELEYLASKNLLIATPDFEFRFIPSWQLLAQYLQQDYVGKKYLIKIDWLVASRANPQRPWNWYSRTELGGGVLGAVGSHCFDYISWLFGPVKRLSAHLSSAIATRPDPLSNNQLKPVTSDDTNLIMLELADGTPCQICLSSVANNGRGHWLEIYGEKGTLVLGSNNLKDYVHGFRLWVASPDKPLNEVEIPKNLAFPQLYTDGRLAPFIRVVDTWVQGIKQAKQTIPSLQDGIYSQLLMDLTHQSHLQKTWVDVPSDF